MSYVSTKEALEKELSSMGKSVSHPVVSIYSDRQKVDIEVQYLKWHIMTAILFSCNLCLLQ